jgi:hypothetical protein
MLEVMDLQVLTVVMVVLILVAAVEEVLTQLIHLLKETVEPAVQV